MRLSLGESQSPLTPMVFIFTQSLTFTPQDYIDMGYLYYDVMCIGAAGGYGGTVGSVSPGYGDAIVAGGAPGGGGAHLVRNRPLSELASTVAVVVGTAGANGTNAPTSATAAYTVATNGSNGGYSSFNTNTCKASGGIGGKKPTTNGAGAVSVYGYGGAGGKGNQTTAGGGFVPASQTDQFNGSWDGSIGTGGSGGAGRRATWSTGVLTYLNGTPSVGAYGSYPSENSAGQGRKPAFSSAIGDSVTPTGGGGAKPYTLTTATKVYGTSGITSATSSPNGVVVLRLFT